MNCKSTAVFAGLNASNYTVIVSYPGDNIEESILFANKNLISHALSR
ncbi:MAG: hypothetical protein ACI389_06660 [Methanobrevibacter sp.]